LPVYSYSESFNASRFSFRRALVFCLKHIDGVIGNSSSGLHEVPSLDVPTIDIGNRQQGRTRGLSVYNVEADKKLILKKIKMLLEKNLVIEFSNPYIANIDSTQAIHDKIVDILNNKKIK
jgi:UDP-N-acetylglucosamine 2-epimerase